MCTANDETTIPGPLRDRMEIVRLSGYDIPGIVTATVIVVVVIVGTLDTNTNTNKFTTTIITTTTTTTTEKVKIGLRYLIPKAFHEAGLCTDEEVKLYSDSVYDISSSSSSGSLSGSGSVEVSGSDDNSSVVMGNIKVFESTLEKLVKDYCRESGVRSLQVSDVCVWL